MLRSGEAAIEREVNDPDDVVPLGQALLSLPRELGPHPEDGEQILAGVGRFGPYVRHGSKYKTIPADESVLDIGMNRAELVKSVMPSLRCLRSTFETVCSWQP